jgi:2-polyprenyl-3-methyl-5-hydroxy-6-metoxy-1,4-benzoquinol methylase
MRLSLRALPYEAFYRIGLHRVTWHRDDPMPEVVEWHGAGKLTGASALEVGAGAASNALWLARQGFSATAVDFSPRAVKLARDRGAREHVALHTRLVDVTRGDRALGRFDVIIDRECLQDLKHPVQRSRYAHNVRTWMADGAALVIATWVYRNGVEERRRFPTARLADAEVPRLFPDLTVQERRLESRRLFGVSGLHAVFLLRRAA